MNSDKVSIVLKNSEKLVFMLDHKAASDLIDQFYEICSKDLSDNVLEVTVPSNNEVSNDTVLIKGDEIVYVRRINENTGYMS